MKVLIAGDFCDRGRVSDVIAQNQFDSLFGEIQPVVRTADVSVVNFEFPVVVPGTGDPIVKSGPTLKGQVAAIDAVRYAGFTVCTLANNHILDQGPQCCLSTQKLLEAADIRTVGVGKNLAEAMSVLYVKQGSETLAIVNCCEHEFSIATEATPGANPLNPIRQYHQIQEARKHADYVLVIVHGGHEYCQLPSPRMKETYRFFIDIGADAVVNHHQHCFSGYELYDGHLICYGLGNLLFDHPSKRHDSWNEGYMLMVDFHAQQCDYELLPYKQCDDRPSVRWLSDMERQEFDSKIKSLNAIIADDVVLQKSVETWMLSGSRSFLIPFQPYQTSWGKRLFVHHLLPSFLTARKKRQMQNYITCEAHLDKLRVILSK